jgi:hypothetical protein
MIVDDLSNISSEVEKNAEVNGGMYIDAVLVVCDEYNLDPVIVSRFLSKPIIEKIKLEGQEINLIPKENVSILPLVG